MADIGSGGEFCREELLESVPVCGDDFQQEVGFSDEHVAFPDFWPLLDGFFELLQVVFGLACEPHEGEDDNGIAERFGVDIGVIAADDAFFLEGSDSSEAGRSGYSDSFGQFDIGHSSVVLQVLEDTSVDIIESVFLSHVGFR